MTSDSLNSVNLRTLREVARALIADTDTREVLRTLCEAAMLQGRATGAAVAHVRSDDGSFVAGSGVGNEMIGTDFPLTGSITDRVIRERRAIAINSPEESSIFLRELLRPLKTGPVLLIPLLAERELLGVLSVLRSEKDAPFDAVDEERLGTIADLAALALWRVRALEEARAADRAKTSLLATLSHELRTPLAAVEGYGELLEDEILGPLAPQQRDVIMRLRAVGRHLGALIEDILTFASLEADRVTARNSDVNIDELLDSLHPYVELLAREKSIEFAIELDEDLPLLHTDEARVRQILLNLCQNAVKFTETGEVRLRVNRGAAAGATAGVASGAAAGADEGTVRFAGHDTGIGIGGSDLERLFRPFSQLEDVAARRHRGTGLGLYISQRLATLLNGRIEVVSRLKEGSIFTLVLPA